MRLLGSKAQGSVVVAHGLNCFLAGGIFPDQGSNPLPRIGRWILIHCVTRDVPETCVVKLTLSHFCPNLVEPIYLFGNIICVLLTNFKLVFIYFGQCWVFAAAQWTFSSCSEWGPLSVCGAWASHWGGVSCGAQALECRLNSCGTHV